jgi:GTP-binding protein
VDAIVVETAAAIARRPAGHPAIIATSARTGLGIDRLRAEIAEIAAATPIGDDGL